LRLLQEQAKHGDLVFVRRGSGTGYRSIVYKVHLPSLSLVAEDLREVLALLIKENHFNLLAAQNRSLKAG